MICVNCGKENKDGSKFCAFCGTPVAVLPVEAVPAEEQPVTEAPVEAVSTEEQPVAEAPAEAASVEQPETEASVEAAPAEGQTTAFVQDVPTGVPMQEMPQTGTTQGMPQAGATQGWQQPGAPMQGMPQGGAAQGWQQSGMPVQGMSQAGAVQGWQQSGAPMQGMPAQNWQPAAVPPPVQNKKKGKAGLIVIIVLIVLLLAGGGVAAFLLLGNSPVKKIESAFASGDVYTATELFEKVKSEKDIEAVEALARDYAEQIKDKYINEEIDYEEAKDVLYELEVSILKKDGRLEKISELVDHIMFGRSGYESAEDFKEAGDYISAWTCYAEVVEEDTLYYDKAQAAIEEVKGLYRQEALDDAQYYLDMEDYDMAKYVLEDALGELYEDAELSSKLESVEQAIAEAEAQAAAQAAQEMEKISGVWGMEIEMGPYLASELGEGFEEFDGSFIINLLMEFTSDGSYKMYVDKDSFRENFDVWMDKFVEYSVEMLYKEFESQGVSRKEADKLVEESFGSNMEDYLRDMMSYYLDYEDLLDDMQNSGSYTVDGNKICWDGDSYNYDLFTVTGDTLTIDAPAGMEGEEIFPGVTYPLVFNRVVQEEAMP